MREKAMKRVLLINMPFAGVEFPSLALGLFKARFQQEGIPCDVVYLNLLFAEMVGLENYALIGQYNGTFAGEQMFAQTLFGSHVPEDRQFYDGVIAQFSRELPSRLAYMKVRVRPFLDRCLTEIPWSSYDVIGFTSLFEQSLPSLALAYLVKRRFPSKCIILGGANCEDIMGLTMHQCFPCIDYVFAGEADDTFPELVKRLIYGHPVHDLRGIVYRGPLGKSVYTGDAPKTLDLDALPFPNFDDFYARQSSSAGCSALATWMLMETARGCWWGEKAKCTFCGLNGKTIRFRTKSAPRIIAELKYLLDRYRRFNVNYIRMVDNVIAPQHFAELLPRLATLGLGTRLFFEIRPTLRKAQLKALAEAGVTDIQAGLESLNSHTLKLMRKGTTSLQNIQLLKWSKQFGINASWNIIFGFPGEVPADYANSLDLANVLTHLNPPVGFGPFRLDRFSFNLEHATELDLVNVQPQSIYRYLYPFNETALFNLCYYFDYSHRMPLNNGGFQYPLLLQVNRWKRQQDQLYSQRLAGRVVIIDTRPVATAPQVELEGLGGLIYEYCDQSRTVAQIRRWLSERRAFEAREGEVEGILSECVARKLMVHEDGHYLSLAVMTYVPDFEREMLPGLGRCGS